METDHTHREDPLRGTSTFSFSHCRVSVARGPGEGKSVDTSHPLIRIGSAEDNDLVISDRSVSRHHLEVRRHKGQYFVVDLGSTNGTYIGSARVNEALI